MAAQDARALLTDLVVGFDQGGREVTEAFVERVRALLAAPEPAAPAPDLVAIYRSLEKARAAISDATTATAKLELSRRPRRAGRLEAAELPFGIVSVHVDDLGVGNCLFVNFKNGRQLIVDALSLGDKECQAVLMDQNYSEDEEDDGMREPLAWLAFDGTGRVSSQTYDRKCNECGRPEAAGALRVGRIGGERRLLCAGCASSAAGGQED